MSPSIATALYAFGILGLLMLDRDRKVRTSKALWIPMAWLFIIVRPVSVWLGSAPQPSSPDQYLEGSPLDGAVFAALLALGLIVLAGRTRRVGVLLRGNGPILLFLLYCAVSILWSDYPGVALKRWIKFIGDLVMVLIVLTDTDPSAAVKRFLPWTGFLLVPLSVLLIKYYPDLGRAYNPWTWMPEWTGVATGKNGLGMITMIFGLASLWRFLQELWTGEGRRRGPLIAHGTVLAMALWLFAKAHSMTSLSSFVVAGGLMAVVMSPTALARRPATVHLLMGTILSASVAIAYLDIGGLVAALGRDPTLTGRTEIWSRAISMDANPLLGTGFDSFWLGERLKEMWSLYYFHPNQAHNGYLEVYLNLGWVGVALLAGVLTTSYRNALGALLRDRRGGSLYLAYFLVAVVYNLTEAAFKESHPVWIAFLLAATSLATAPAGERANILSRVRIRPGRHRPDLPAAEPQIYEGVV